MQIALTWLSALKAGDLGRSASQRPARVKIDESSFRSPVQLPSRSLLCDCRWCHECIPRGTAGSKPTEWVARAWKFRTRATSGSYPAFYPDFSESGYSDFRALWSHRSNSICSGCARIREPPDSFLAQLTVSNIPELMGQHLEKSIFPCRRKLSFFNFRISIEHRITLRRLFLSP